MNKEEKKIVLRNRSLDRVTMNSVTVLLVFDLTGYLNEGFVAYFPRSHSLPRLLGLYPPDAYRKIY